MKNFAKINSLTLSCFLLLSLLSCTKDLAKEIPTAPTVTIKALSNITSNSVTTGGKIISDGGSEVTMKGICWSTTKDPTRYDQSTIEGIGVGEFTSSITGLFSAKEYTLKAYAVNSIGTGYSEPISFFTSANKPEVSTVITYYTSTSITTGGNVLSDGGSPITARGVCWSLKPNPTIDNDKTSDGIGIGSYVSLIQGLLGETTYYFRAYATNSIGTSYGKEERVTTISATPIVTTNLIVQNITATSANCSGNVIDDKGLNVIARGICYSKTKNPTITDRKTSIGSGLGNFVTQITGLEADITYYIRAYATNSAGTGYGDEVSFTPSLIKDADGNIYSSVQIGKQVWMVENLKTTKYSNGDKISTTDNSTHYDIPTIDIPYFQWAYKGNLSNAENYGRLYTWYVVTNIKSLCPDGWRIPAYDDWATLVEYLADHNFGHTNNNDDVAKAIAAGGNFWPTSSVLGAVGNDQASNNKSGFKAVPGGNVAFNWVAGFTGDFRNGGINGYWWTKTSYSTTQAWGFEMYFDSRYVKLTTDSKRNGRSVRCIKY